MGERDGRQGEASRTLAEDESLEDTLKEREVKERQRAHDAVQSACNMEDEKTQEQSDFQSVSSVNVWSECQSREKKADKEKKKEEIEKHRKMEREEQEKEQQRRRDVADEKQRKKQRNLKGKERNNQKRSE